MKPKKSRGDDTEYTQKVWLKKSFSKVYEDWVNQLPLHLASAPPSESTFRTWVPFYMYLACSRVVISCVCVYHATWALLEAGLNDVRKECHKSRKERIEGADPCAWGNTCNCSCLPCTNTKPLLSAAVCEYVTLPSLPCVLQECTQCGIEKVLICDAKEEHAMSHTTGVVKKYIDVERTAVGFDAKKKAEPTKTACTLASLFTEIRSETLFTLMHDYLARRLANMFHHHIETIQSWEEVWVMDYIENFACFQEYALQQDHFSHNQITIFVILCFRHKRVDEDPVAPTHSLPAHITCELHAFISDDPNHDAAFAQLSMETVLRKKEENAVLPTRVKLWSDGGPAHFKMYMQLWFMAAMGVKYGLTFWWCFFQSCHGKSYSSCTSYSMTCIHMCRERHA